MLKILMSMLSFCVVIFPYRHGTGVSFDLDTKPVGVGWVSAKYFWLPLEVLTQREESIKHCRLFHGPYLCRKQRFCTLLMKPLVVTNNTMSLL